MSGLVHEAEAVERREDCEELLKLRVLIVTHGGVIRQWLARFQSGETFHTAAAPPPGTATVIKLLWPAARQ
ncbi:hypothetical protein D3C81_2190970 [compost metagenome]